MNGYANVYLHYALDLWVDWWRRSHARGDMIYVRYGDDTIIGFEYRSDANGFLADLRVRLAKFALELHSEKTRLIEFGRFAAQHRKARGLGAPETFNFLGFTHICDKDKSGRFWIRRITISKRLRAKLSEVKHELTQRRHQPIPEQGAGYVVWCKGISTTTLCQGTTTRSRPAANRSRGTGTKRCGAVASGND